MTGVERAGSLEGACAGQRWTEPREGWKDGKSKRSEAGEEKKKGGRACVGIPTHKESMKGKKSRQYSTSTHKK